MWPQRPGNCCIIAGRPHYKANKQQTLSAGKPDVDSSDENILVAHQPIAATCPLKPPISCATWNKEKTWTSFPGPRTSIQAMTSVDPGQRSAREVFILCLGSWQQIEPRHNVEGACLTEGWSEVALLDRVLSHLFLPAPGGLMTVGCQFRAARNVCTWYANQEAVNQAARTPVLVNRQAWIEDVLLQCRGLQEQERTDSPKRRVLRSLRQDTRVDVSSATALKSACC